MGYVLVSFKLSNYPHLFLWEDKQYLKNPDQCGLGFGSLLSLPNLADTESAKCKDALCVCLVFTSFD